MRSLFVSIFVLVAASVTNAVATETKTPEQIYEEIRKQEADAYKKQLETLSGSGDPSCEERMKKRKPGDTAVC